MEQLQDYNDWEIYRFQCDCMDPGCCLDLEVTVEEDGRAPIIISINDNGSRAPLWQRIKSAFKYLLRGHHLPVAEICVRKKDEANLIKVLQEHGWEDIHVKKETEANDPTEESSQEP